MHVFECLCVCVCVHGITQCCLVGETVRIQADYRGEIHVGLHNLSREDYIIKPKERIAQLVVTPILYEEIEITDDLEETKRGTGGFGSTGKL